MLHIVNEPSCCRRARFQDIRGRDRGVWYRGALVAAALVPTDWVDARGSERFDVEGDEPTAFMAVARGCRPFGGLDS